MTTFEFGVAGAVGDRREGLAALLARHCRAFVANGPLDSNASFAQLCLARNRTRHRLTGAGSWGASS